MLEPRPLTGLHWRPLFRAILMGYSISVRLPTRERRDQALAFWEQDLQTHPHPYNIQPVRGEDLSYPPSGNPEPVVSISPPAPRRWWRR